MQAIGSFRRPQALQAGDLVAIVAPASPFERQSFQAGLECLAERYRVQHVPGIFERQRYLAGEDARRLAELNEALAEPAVRGIFCARGGYGAMRLLSGLAPPPEPMKPLVGFSDITALHFWSQRHGFASIHGPVLTQLPSLSTAARARLFSMLESPVPPSPLSGTDTFVAGSVEGPLLGGNLSMVTRLLGTPFVPPLEGAVLLLEDRGERPYRLDRMWTHLELAGVFAQISGIALGSFCGCEDGDPDYTSQQVLRDLATATGLPCAAGFPIGHGERNEPVPLGTRVRLDATARTLSFLEPAVESHLNTSAHSG